jgi:hypothetical protein
MAYDHEEATLLTVGEDGKLKIWDREERRLAASVQVSEHPLVRVALHPERSIAAVVSSNGSSQFTLTAWDWKERERLYAVPLQEEPLRLTYAPKGNYIVYSVPSFQSIRVLDADDGERLDYLERDTGIVSYFTVASSERTVMVYVPAAGRLEYFSVRGNRSLKRVSTQSNLERMQLLPGKRHAVAVNGQSLTVIDVVNGEVVDTYPLGAEVYDIAVDATDGTIALLVDSLGMRGNNPTPFGESMNPNRESRSSENGASEDAKRVRFFSFSGSFLYPRSIREPRVADDAHLLWFHDRYIFTGTQNGAVAFVRPGRTRPITLARNRLSRITDIALSDGRIYLSTSDSLTSIRSDLFGQGEQDTTEVTSIRTQRISTPLRSIDGIEGGASGTIYAWGPPRETDAFDPTAVEPRLAELVPSSNSQFLLQREEWPPVIDVKYGNETLLVLHNDGSFRRLSPTSLQSTFRYSSLGLQTVISTDDHGLLVARNRTNEFESSLLQIDPDTGETVLIPNDNFIVFEMVYDRSRGRLYTLGLQERGTSTRTVLSAYRGPQLSRSRTLYSVEGEELDATLALDESRGRIYTSLGTDALVALDRYGNRRTLEVLDSVPQRLIANPRYVYAINHDGTLAMWDAESEEPLLTLYMTPTGSWTAITASDHYISSDSSAERLLSYTGDRGFFSRSLEDFRLELPATIQ